MTKKEKKASCKSHRAMIINGELIRSVQLAICKNSLGIPNQYIVDFFESLEIAHDQKFHVGTLHVCRRAILKQEPSGNRLPDETPSRFSYSGSEQVNVSVRLCFCTFVGAKGSQQYIVRVGNSSCPI